VLTTTPTLHPARVRQPSHWLRLGQALHKQTKDRSLESFAAHDQVG
jgi:hypothetical protein